ncbi:hypothetical protein DFH28DRAFT_882085 [Melampsora americana]|nr:hypothetical protein DFH28DRAFT_916668 [Melampsora americana]KAH9822294.1 hypothetical protein DFH28DRAFT_882085 [Melampsora americana]
MRWATTTHDRIWTRLISLSSEINSDPILVAPFTYHPTLSYLPPQDRRNAATVVIKDQFLKTTNLQLTWHEDLLNLFSQTQRQAGDVDLLQTWTHQLQHITTLHEEGKMSTIPGDINNPIVNAMEAPEIEEPEIEEPAEVFIEDDVSDASSLDGDDDDGISGLVHGIDLVDINAAVDPTTLFM